MGDGFRKLWEDVDRGAGLPPAKQLRIVPPPTARRSKDPSRDHRFTPRELMEQLHAEFRFTIDVAGHPLSPAAKIIGRHWTVAEDGLEQSWAGERFFCNPPFSLIPAWVEKAWREPAAGVMLLPANRTEQPWWQDLVEPFRDRGPFGLRTRFLRTRRAFGSPESPDAGKKGAPFGLVLLVWPPGGRA